MKQCWLIVGTEKNWKVAFENNNIWGLKDFRELKGLWNMLREGDGLLFYVSKPVHGIVGFGNVVTKFRQTIPLWSDEIRKNTVIWPLRFEFDIEYCLPPNLWETHKFTSHNLEAISRMVFQCFPVEEVNTARSTLGLQPLIEAVLPSQIESPVVSKTMTMNHEVIKTHLAEIGRMQGFVADKEYTMEGGRLDVVWRRVERSVLTFVFEVQIGGDTYHAMAKLKHAFDLWNSHIFFVATIHEKGKYEELLSGTFHEVKNHMRFIDITMVEELLKRKKDYKDLERNLGILKI